MRFFLSLILLFLPLLQKAEQIVSEELARKLKIKTATENVKFSGTQEAFTITEYYDRQGHCTRKLLVDLKGVLLIREDFTYNKKNRLLLQRRVQYINTDSIINEVPVSAYIDSINKPRYTYDRKGRVKVCRQGASITYYEYKFDSIGRLKSLELKTLLGEQEQLLLQKELRFYTYLKGGKKTERKIVQSYQGDEAKEAAPLNESVITTELSRYSLPLKRSKKEIRVPEGIRKNDSESTFSYTFYK